MIRRRACLLVALAAAAAIPAASIAAGGASQARPEHARLIAMCGTWGVEMTFWSKPDAAALTALGTSTIQSLLASLFIEERIEGVLNGTPFTTLAWTGFNTGTRQYEATRISTTNTARIAETGSYDEKTKQFELKADYPLAGQTWHQRTVIEPISAEKMLATSYLSFGTVPEWKAVEIKYTRKH